MLKNKIKHFKSIVIMLFLTKNKNNGHCNTPGPFWTNKIMHLLREVSKKHYSCIGHIIHNIIFGNVSFDRPAF